MHCVFVDVDATRTMEYVKRLKSSSDFANVRVSPLLVMAKAAGWIESGAWIPTLFLIAFVTVIASGAQYVWLWGRKAYTRSGVR